MDVIGQSLLQHSAAHQAEVVGTNVIWDVIYLPNGSGGASAKEDFSEGALNDCGDYPAELTVYRVI